MKVAITSEKSPLPEEKHRSSINFTTEALGKDANVKVKVFYDYDTPNPVEATGVTFDVKIDRLGPDGTWIADAKTGMTEKNTTHRNLYISNPKNAERKFTVEFSKE
ncbi:hypothetical protein MsAg5_09910 [Methanosarcinaceae archaeon Ag5]|uniref:Uncharacterized protein n=1 Tax=Methanolapillus africanus TaxID=3028297 RepID=A0AAE4MID1_9EURY|nr:hypothetical protein [Methanosarcinaceae archaeon Ag5]